MIRLIGTKVGNDGAAAAVHPVEVWYMWAEVSKILIDQNIYTGVISYYNFTWHNPKLRNDVQ